MKLDNRRIYVIGNGLVTDFSKTDSYRYSANLFQNKPTNLVLFGQCNFHCRFCFTGGGESIRTVLPNTKRTTFYDFEKHILDSIEPRSIVRISGGEPTMFRDHLLLLCKAFVERGDFVIVDTNASIPDIVLDLAHIVHVVSIDGPKSSRAAVEHVTGVRSEHSWDKPMRTLNMLKSSKSKALIELKTVIFDYESFGHAEMLYKILPENSFLTLKSLQTTRLSDPSKQYSSRITIDSAIPYDANKLLETAKWIVRNNPEVKKRILTICGSTRSKKNYAWAIPSEINAS